ncbi:MAG TPA: hypothetical protein VGF48_15915 [Thermoanaerobaculia bacterium]
MVAHHIDVVAHYIDVVAALHRRGGRTTSTWSPTSPTWSHHHTGSVGVTC